MMKFILAFGLCFSFFAEASAPVANYEVLDSYKLYLTTGRGIVIQSGEVIYQSKANPRLPFCRSGAVSFAHNKGHMELLPVSGKRAVVLKTVETDAYGHRQGIYCSNPSGELDLAVFAQALRGIVELSF